MPTVLTGARVSLTADHRERGTGRVHGHTWTITAWQTEGGNALWLQDSLNSWASQYEGGCLPDRIAWGEDMAADVARFLTSEFSEPTRVEVTREKEGLFAEWSSR